MEQTELTLFRKSIQQFAKKEVAPYYEMWEKEGIIPQTFWRTLGEAGLLCVDLPEKYGGLNVPYRYAATVVEEFSKLGYASLAVNITVHANIVAHYIYNYGTEAQKETYLSKMCSGEIVGAIAMTEPNAGSDLQSIQTKANIVGDQLQLNGAKTFITNGQTSNLIIVAAITNPKNKPSKGMSLLLIDDPHIKGFQRGRNFEKIGLHACDTSELFFEDVLLTKEHVLGPLNEGFQLLMNELPRERLTLAVCGQGAIEGAITQTIAYVKQRKAFQKQLAQFQHIQFEIAELKTIEKIHRAFITECFQKIEQNCLDNESASIAKYAVAEAQTTVMDKCLQLFGGYGYMKEYPISRFYSDARIQRIYGGTSEIMKMIIAKENLFER